MPQKTNLNVNPYYEDFDASKNFYKILFRPGYSIQTRELTQIQSILQNQVESFGKYAFKQGDLVVPGEVGLNTKLDYVKLSSVSEVAINDGNNNIVYKKYDISQLIGSQIRGLSSGVVANVLETKLATDSTADTVYVNYLSSGNSNLDNTFRQGETLEVVDGVNTPLLVVGTDGSVLPTSIQIINPDTDESTPLESPAMGYASAVKVEEGIYFVNGYFVRNEKQLLVIDDYYNNPSAKVGFTIVEQVVTPEEDASLYDNSIGSANYSAPGAHRLKISLNIKKFKLSEATDKNFIQLITVYKGLVQKKVSPTNYSLIEQTLARRTFDESGDYIVNNFSVDIREYAQKDKNGGVYKVDEFGSYNGLTESEASRKMLAGIGPGKAYIRGYEIVNKETKYLEISKARESLSSDNVTLKTKGLPTFNITNTYGSVPLNKEGGDLTAYPYINLFATYNDGSIGLNGTEKSTDHRQTLNKRGTTLSSNDGIKTITINVTNTTTTLASITDGTFANLADLYFIKTRDDSGNALTTGTLKSLSFAKVNKPLLNSNESVLFLELTVVGEKEDIELLMLEYDPGDNNYQRNLFLSAADAAIDNNELGYIIDYSETITPLVGRAKPSNYFLKNRGLGFNSDSDIILSKGKLAEGGDTYNAIFGLSYFDPEFYTKLLLETTPQNNSFGIGKYVVGLTSGAYGVVEGAPSGTYSIGNILFVKTLSGKFTSGESIRDESGVTNKIATDNTISKFIVVNRGLGYADGSTIVINGVEYDAAAAELMRLTNGSFYTIQINNKSALSIEYSQPPSVSVKQPEGAANPSVSAVILPILTRNAVTTYTPQNVKSVTSQYGSGNANIFTADLVTDDQSYAEIKSVTDFTFFGSKGYNFIESTSFNADASILLQQGDVIQFSDESNTLVRAVVQYATQRQGSAKSRVYMDTVLPGNVTNTSIVRLRPRVENANLGTLLFPTGSNQIKKVSSTPVAIWHTKVCYFY